MRVLILGAGVIGVTTAWYLTKSGHAVTVIDRQPTAGLETSFANAGQISPAYSTPWAAPGLVWKALKWLVQAHSPLAIRPDGSLFQLQWMFQMLQNCTAQKYIMNKTRMIQLAQYSQSCLANLRNDIDIAYDGQQLGTLQVFRTNEQLAAAARDIEVLRESGVAFEILTPQQACTAEPGIASDKIAGALKLPQDETGDCHLFTVRLTEHCAKLGTVFEWNRNITEFENDSERITGIWIDQERRTADHYVLALGSYSRNVAQTAGASIPVYPMKGYSLSVPIVQPERAPRSTVMDEAYKVAITRLNQQIRVAGMAEVAGFDLSLNQKRRDTLEMVLSDLFPSAGNAAEGSFWTGLRPMTPDSTPIIGRGKQPNLWINTGHGTLGWTMACGSGKLIADLIGQKTLDIDPTGLGPERYWNN